MIHKCMSVGDRKKEKENVSEEGHYTHYAATRHRNTRHGIGSRNKHSNVAEWVDLLKLEDLYFSALYTCLAWCVARMAWRVVMVAAVVLVLVVLLKDHLTLYSAPQDKPPSPMPPPPTQQSQDVGEPLFLTPLIEAGKIEVCNGWKFDWCNVVELWPWQREWRALVGFRLINCVE